MGWGTEVRGPWVLACEAAGCVVGVALADNLGVVPMDFWASGRATHEPSPVGSRPFG